MGTVRSGRLPPISSGRLLSCIGQFRPPRIGPDVLASRDGQEEQLGALGLVVNMIVVWNTLYLDRALADVRSRGGEVQRADVERLSPLGHEHISFTGHYSFALADPVRRGGYMPLREYDEAELVFA
jgi:hypothetical protein